MKNHSSLTIFTTILSVLACFGLLPQMQAADGDLGGGNTNEGFNALNNLTTGGFNTGLGWYSQWQLTDGFFNTAVGAGSLDLNNGNSNTAAGTGAMLLNLTANNNTAVGTDALIFNDFTSTSPSTANNNTAFRSEFQYRSRHGSDVAQLDCQQQHGRWNRRADL